MNTASLSVQGFYSSFARFVLQLVSIPHGMFLRAAYLACRGASIDAEDIILDDSKEEVLQFYVVSQMQTGNIRADLASFLDPRGMTCFREIKALVIYQGSIRHFFETKNVARVMKPGQRVVVRIFVPVHEMCLPEHFILYRDLQGDLSVVECVPPVAV